MLPTTLILGTLVATVLFFSSPALTESSLNELRYVVDWVFLSRIALGAGALVALGAWPILVWLADNP